MSCTEFLKARVSPEIKLQVKAIADRELLSEAAWLKRLVVREIRALSRGRRCDGREPCRADSALGPAGQLAGERAAAGRMFVRLRNEDRLLLDARADGSGDAAGDLCCPS